MSRSLTLAEAKALYERAGERDRMQAAMCVSCAYSREADAADRAGNDDVADRLNREALIWGRRANSHSR